MTVWKRAPGLQTTHGSSTCSFPKGPGSAQSGLEGWWRLFRRDALAGQSFANADEIEQATRVAIIQLNARAKPWVWGRPPKTPRYHRRLFSYRI
jgi:hypothetical protein